MRSSTRRLIALAGVLVLVSAVAAASASAGPSAGKITGVKVGSFPFGVTIGAKLGYDKGFFKNAGLDVQFVTTGNTAVAIAGVQSGSLDIAGGSDIPVMGAIAQGVPLKVIAPQAGTVAGSQCILAKQGTKPSQIHNYAVNTLAGNQQITGRLWLRARGVDDSKVSFVQIPYASMPAAVQNGQVDAADSIAPFIDDRSSRGLVCLGDSLTALAPYGTPTAVWFTSESFLKAHPEIVKTFTQVILKSNAYTAAHPSEGKAELVSLSGVTPEQAQQTKLFAFPKLFTAAIVQKEVRLATQFGLVSKPLTVQQIFWSGAKFTKKKKR